MNIVGTPYSDVQRSAATVSSTRSGSNASPGTTTHAPRGRAREVADHHAEAVVERHRHADPIALGVAQRLADEVAVVEHVVVRQRRALGEPGRARGVLDVDRVVELERRLALGEPLGGHARAAPRAAPSQSSSNTIASRSGRAAGADLGEHRDVVGVAEPARHRQHADARLVEHVLELGRLVGRVDVDEDRADPRRRVLQDDPLEAIGRPDADPIAALRCSSRAGRARPPRSRPTAADRSRGSPASGRPAPRGRGSSRPCGADRRRSSRRAVGYGRLTHAEGHGGVTDRRRERSGT